MSHYELAPERIRATISHSSAERASLGKPGLDGVQILRFIAAFSVVLHHALEEAGASAHGSPAHDWMIVFGASGVDIFFVISGFIMVYSTFAETKITPSPLQFFAERCVRIYPLFWIACLTVIALKVVGFYASINLDPTSLISSIFLLKPDNDLIYVAWTLSYEMLFYVIFALTLAVNSSRASIFLSSTTLILLFFVSNIMPFGEFRSFFGNSVCLEFCLGLALAELSKNKAAPVLFSMPAVAIAIMLLILSSMVLPTDGTSGLSSSLRGIAWGLPAAIIVGYCINATNSELTPLRSLKKLGDASYAIYLFHTFVMIIYAFLLKKTTLNNYNQAVPVLLVVTASVYLGLLIHVALEKNLTRYLKRKVLTSSVIKRTVRV